MQELMAFAHGMANFAHNRGTKKAQERLISTQLQGRHNFLGSFDDSGNFAFRTIYNALELKTDVHAALNLEYTVEGVAIIDRFCASSALASLETLVRAKYKESFLISDYTIWQSNQRWRAGFVFLGSDTVFPLNDPSYRPDERVQVLIVQPGVVGLLKFDPKIPRIPWGAPANVISGALPGITSKVLATGRSARTVRGLLRKFD